MCHQPEQKQFSHPPLPFLPHNQENVPPSTPAFVEPIRPRKKRKTEGNLVDSMTDAEVWHLDDKAIMDAFNTKCSSDVYDHYNMALERCNVDGINTIFYIYTCKFNDPKHKPTRRKRGLSSNTSNMGVTAQTCIRRDPHRNITHSGDPSTSGSIYSPARHRALLALRSAASKRSYNIVNDPWYMAEVEMFRPGTIIPSADTVAEDLHRLYLGYAPLVRKYFEERNRELHVIVDGWTAPFADSYLGCIIQWEDHGELYETTLEFIKLTERHTGSNLAKALADTLHRYGLARFVHIYVVICINVLY